MMNASIDLLATHANLHSWKLSPGIKCKLRGNMGTTNHILNFCNIMLETGRYTK